MGRKVWAPTVSGPLAPCAAGFESWLKSRAYSPSALADRLYHFDQLSRWLLAAQAARLQLDTLRLRLIKIGGWFRESTRFAIPDVCVHLSSHHPVLALWLLLARARRIHSWRW